MQQEGINKATNQKLITAATSLAWIPWLVGIFGEMRCSVGVVKCAGVRIEGTKRAEEEVLSSSLNYNLLQVNDRSLCLLRYIIFITVLWL